MKNEDKQIVRREYEKVWHGNNKMVDHCVSSASGYIMIDGIMVVMEKPHIKTDFWFGEHTYDYDEVCKRCEEASKSEERFMRENIEHCMAHRYIEALENDVHGYRPYLRGKAYNCQDDDCKLGYIDWQRPWETNGKEIKELDDGEKELLLRFCKDELAKFEKRLRTYLKRYGLSKCHFGVFWADR